MAQLVEKFEDGVVTNGLELKYEPDKVEESDENLKVNKVMVITVK